ncbi:gigaxonin isoform X2 [Procambarus clarkii]|uniref:gigaxonin isoform X2 n=1 Tax=Procambarus clarkii TaxID=6728 RepID=UPI001E6703C0|nr:gigaxonin-like isoform X2 [Procambarus clarkii]
MNRQEYTTGTLHASRVLKELSTFRHFAALCDGTVKLSDGTVKVSKALLASGCPYFKVLFEFEEESQGGLHRTTEPRLDIACKTFELILDFIYTGRVILDNDNIQDILQASDLLLMTDLKELCIRFLMARIDVDNCLGILQFAQQFSCPRLVRFAQDFICQHFKHRQIVRTDEFRNLSEERLKDLLSQDGLTVKSEVDILTALVVWLNSNLAETPDVESLVTSCLRESSDLKYDPKFQRALQDIRAGNPPWDSPGASRVLDALKKTRRIRSIRERGMKTVLACCDGNTNIYLVDILGSGKHAGAHVRLPPMCFPRIKPALVVEGGYLFALGGISTDRVLQNDVQKYDPVTNSWTLMSPMPFACCSPRIVAHAGKLYVLGGYNNEVELEMSNLEEFDIYSNKWRTLPSIPNVRRGAAVAVSDEKIFYIGGSPWQELPDGSPFFRVLDAVEIFCIKEEIWVAGPQLKERRSYATAVSHGGNIFVIGGARPIECPSAQGQLKVTGTEALFSDSPMGWTILSKLRVPNEAKIQTTALANNEHLVIVGKGDSSDIMRDNCFVMETSGWAFPPGAESILTSGTNIFFSYALLTLPIAAMQDLFSEDSE